MTILIQLLRSRTVWFALLLAVLSVLQAYREQAKHYPTDRRLEFAGYIATQYGLNIHTEDAYKLFTKD